MYVIPYAAIRSVVARPVAAMRVAELIRPMEYRPAEEEHMSRPNLNELNPTTEQELLDAIRRCVAYVREAVPPDGLPTQESLADGYERVVHAMADVAYAASRYIAHEEGASGYQVNCADLEYVRRSRQLRGPFMVIDGQKLLYPDYRLEEEVQEAIKQWKSDWLPLQASLQLKSHPDASGKLKNYWTGLARSIKTT